MSIQRDTMRALLLIDLQMDFLPGGSLAIEEGDLVIPVAKALMARRDLFPVVALTQDFHPADHQSFASNRPGASVGDVVDLHGLPQVMWPDHCVQGSPGVAFHPEIDLAQVDHISPKGTHAEVDSYSGFFDNGRRATTDLEAFLRGRGVTELVVMGLATDYCVRWSVLDALSLGFKVTVIRDGCRGVGLKPGDIEMAWDEMMEAGARCLTLADYEREVGAAGVPADAARAVDAPVSGEA